MARIRVAQEDSDPPIPELGYSFIYPKAGNWYTINDEGNLQLLGVGEGDVTDSLIGVRTVDDDYAPNSDTGFITDILSNLANRIKQITGETSWRNTVTLSLNDFVKRAGDTMTGVLDATAGVKSTNLKLYGGTAAAAVETLLEFLHNNYRRWAITKTLSNDLTIRRYNTLGTFVDEPFAISSATGRVRATLDTGTVSNSSLADSSVTSSKIANEAITGSKIASTGTFVADKFVSKNQLLVETVAINFLMPITNQQKSTLTKSEMESSNYYFAQAQINADPSNLITNSASFGTLYNITSNDVGWWRVNVSTAGITTPSGIDNVVNISLVNTANGVGTTVSTSINKGNYESFVNIPTPGAYALKTLFTNLGGSSITSLELINVKFSMSRV